MSSFRVAFLLIIAVSSFFAAYNGIELFSDHLSISRQLLETKARRARLTDHGGAGLPVGQILHPVHPVVKQPASSSKKRRLRPFHTAVTCSDGVYNRWQVRIMYYWYKKFQAMPGGEEMGGFTRILHSGVPDKLMNEIPTVIVNPLPPGMDKGYVVLNRPWAFVQWISSSNIEEEYVFMAEPDHVILRPIPNIATDHMPAAFPFFYITPKENEKILRKFYPEALGPITDIDPIGNSPVIIKKDDLKKIAPTWKNVSLAMKEDPQADKTFGWVLEMYAYAVASALHGVQHVLRKEWMIQPPWDLETADRFMIHYTYGCDYNLKGELTYGKIGEWRFDKRSFSNSYLPRNMPMPPEKVPESVVTLVRMVNEATGAIEPWIDEVK